MKRKPTAARKVLRRERAQAAIRALKTVMALNECTLRMTQALHNDPAQLRNQLAWNERCPLDRKQLQEIVRAAKQGVRK